MRAACRLRGTLVMGSIIKKQLLADSVKETNGTVTNVSLEKENQIQTLVTHVSLEKVNPIQALTREAVQLKWKSFTTQSCISNKGMGLKFVSHVIVNGARSAKLDKIEVERQSECWVNIVVSQNPTLTSITQYVNTQWHLKEEPTISKHDKGFFIIRLKSREERENVLFSGPHLFFSKPVIVKHWCANFNFHDEIL